MSEQMYELTVRISQSWLDWYKLNTTIRLYPTVKKRWLGLAYERQATWVVNARDCDAIKRWLRDRCIDSHFNARKL